MNIVILTCVQFLVLRVEPAPPFPTVILTFIRGSTSKLPPCTKPEAPPPAAPLPPPPPPPTTSTLTRCTPHGTVNTPDEVNKAKLGGHVFSVMILIDNILAIINHKFTLMNILFILFHKNIMKVKRVKALY